MRRRDPMAARTGVTHPFGKLTKPLPRTTLPDVAYDALAAQAAEARLPLAEYIREVLIVRALGEAMVRSVIERRLAVVAGINPESAQKK